MKNMCKKMLEECKEVINCFFANADVEDYDVVLVDKADEENVIVLNKNFGWKYSYSKSMGLALHMKDKENKIDINVEHVIELNGGDILDLSSRWMLDIM